MKKLAVFACLVLSVIAMVSCGPRKPVLRLYNWGDYISMDVVHAFEKEYNCKVQIDVFDSNEAMYAKLKAGADGYDVIVPSSYIAKLMYAQKMICELDKELLPTVMKYYDRSYKELALDSELNYSVPYFVSFTGIGYNKDKVKDFEPTWQMFKRADIKKRCSMLNDVREAIGAALKTLGYSVNTKDPKQIDEAVALINEWKQNIAKFEVDDAKRALAAGEFNLIQTYSGDMLQVMEEQDNIAFVIPKEGSTVTFDCLAICNNSQNKELAHKFIDFMYRTENATANMDEIMYVMPHTEAVKNVSEDLRKNPAFNISEEDRRRCEALDDLDAATSLYNRAWDRIQEEGK